MNKEHTVEALFVITVLIRGDNIVRKVNKQCRQASLGDYVVLQNL